jgi:hypothetical protein
VLREEERGLAIGALSFSTVISRHGFPWRENDSSAIIRLGEDSDRRGNRLHTATISTDTQHLASVRSLVEQLADHLNRPEPNREITQVLVDVALSGLRKLECASTLEQLLEDEVWPRPADHPIQ